MTPKEKAKELVDKFTLVGLQRRNEGIECALIAVDEIIEALNCNQWQNKTMIDWYNEVKQEIEKLI